MLARPRLRNRLLACRGGASPDVACSPTWHSRKADPSSGPGSKPLLALQVSTDMAGQPIAEIASEQMPGVVRETCKAHVPGIALIPVQRNADAAEPEDRAPLGWKLLTEKSNVVVPDQRCGTIEKTSLIAMLFLLRNFSLSRVVARGPDLHGHCLSGHSKRPSAALQPFR